jgi:crossover junction endodeoxyribonuclease RuvC
VIIGLDPSLTNTAVCYGAAVNVPPQDGYIVRRFGSTASPPDVRSRLARYEDLVARITDDLEAACKLYDGIFIEGYAFGAKMGREQAGEFGGLLRWHLLELSTLIVEVAPHALKKFATGKGAGEKDMVAAHLTKRYGVLLRTNDEYDAYCLWRIGLCYVGQDEPQNDAQREVIEQLKAGPREKPRKLPKPQAKPAFYSEPEAPF